MNRSLRVDVEDNEENGEKVHERELQAIHSQDVLKFSRSTGNYPWVSIVHKRLRELVTRREGTRRQDSHNLSRRNMHFRVEGLSPRILKKERGRSSCVAPLVGERVRL